MSSTCGHSFGRVAAGAILGLALVGALGAEPRSALPLASGRDVFDSLRLGPTPAGFESWRELFKEQDRLNQAAALIRSDPNAREHLAGILAAPEMRRLVVYWKNSIPESTQQLLANLRTSVPVEVRRARFSDRDLQLAGRRLLGQPGVLSFYARSDGSGLDVTMQGDAEISREKLVQRLAQHHAAGDWSSVPLQHSFEMAAMPAAASRDNDTDLEGWYYAGARVMENYYDNRCTLGFGIKWSGGRGWLTAGHCGYPTRSVFYGDNGTDRRGYRVGTLTKIDDYLDIGLIQADDPLNTSTHWMFIGRPHTDKAAIPVGRLGTNEEGNYVFLSGASTGLNGPLKITKINEVSTNLELVVPIRGEVLRDEQPHRWHRAVHIRNLDGSVPAASVGVGDSGAPVFAFLSDGSADARGMATRGSMKRVDCPSETRIPANVVWDCRTELLFADLADSLDRLQRYHSISRPSLLTGSW